MKDLTTSMVSRQNILNNNYAIDEIKNQLKLDGVEYINDTIFTKDQVAQYFNVDVRTIERCVENNKEELEKNGYRVLKGKELKEFKEAINKINGTDINVGTKVTVLSIFTFRTLLNISMLLTESEKAKEVRSVMLDIVIDVINKKTGGNTKYINAARKENTTSILNKSFTGLLFFFECFITTFEARFLSGTTCNLLAVFCC